MSFSNKRFFTFGLLLTSLVLLFSCNDDGRRDIRDYYFPVDSLSHGLVYAYTAQAGDTSDRSYWYYHSFHRDSGVFLAGTQYGRYFDIRQIVREKIVSNGSLARNVYLYQLDTLTEKSITIPTTISATNLFPFKVKDSLGVFLFRLEYSPPEAPDATIYLIRNRRFLGDGPDFEFNGQTYPTIRFGLKEVIGHDEDGTAEVEGNGEEWYAKGLGLVYYRKQFGKNGEVELAYKLTETFPMTELERRAR